jgi:multicomponent Na+:H+ antiporter subunit D
MLFAMGIAAFLCIFIGVFPGPLYSLLPYPVDFEPYTAFHIVGVCQLLFFGAFAYLLLVLSGIFPAEMKATNLDFDWFYRKGATVFMRCCAALNTFRLGLQGVLTRLVDLTAERGLDPLYFPTLLASYLRFKFAQLFYKKKIKDYEFQFRQLQRIGESDMSYSADVPRKPIGLGLLVALALMFLYLLVYLMFYIPKE